MPAPLEGPPLAKPIKVALARIPDDMETDNEVLALLRIAADHLANAGYDVVETDVPDLGGTWKLWCDLIMTELSVLQEAQMRDFGSADFGRTLDGFLKMAAHTCSAYVSDGERGRHGIQPPSEQSDRPGCT